MSSVSHSNKKRNGISSLYLLKAICAFFVVVIHCNLWCKETIQPILGMATPCFMCITGYLLFSDDRQKELGKATRWAKKALMLCIVMNLLHLGQYLWDGADLSDYSIGGMLFNLFTGVAFSTHLWYLSAMWTGLLLFYAIRRYTPVIIIFTPLLYCWAHVCYHWGADIFPQAESYQLFLLRCNGLITGLPFLCTGYMVAKHREQLTAMKRLPLWFLLAFVFLMFGGEALKLLPFRTHGWLHFIVLYIFIILTMALCIRYQNAYIPIVNEIGQYHSANIYFFHILVLIHLGRIGPDVTQWQAIAVFLCTIPVSWCINRGTTILKKFKLRCISRQQN